MSEKEHIFSRKEITEMSKDDYEQNREAIFKQMKQNLIKWFKWYKKSLFM